MINQLKKIFDINTLIKYGLIPLVSFMLLISFYFFESVLSTKKESFYQIHPSPWVLKKTNTHETLNTITDELNLIGLLKNNNFFYKAFYISLSLFFFYVLLLILYISKTFKKPFTRLIDAAHLISDKHNTSLTSDTKKNVELSISDEINQVSENIKYLLNLKNKIEEENIKLKEIQLLSDRYFEIADVILLVTDKEGKITKINRKGTEVIGADDSNLIGYKITDFFVDSEKNKFSEDLFLESIKNENFNKFHNRDFCLKNKLTDRIYIIHWTNNFIIDDFGTIHGVVSSGVDITKRKELEKELEISYQKTIKISKLAGMAELAGQIAHEINTPLGALLLTTDNILTKVETGILDKPFLEEQLEFIKKIINHTSKISDTIRRLSTDGKTENPVTTTVEDFIKESLTVVKGKIHKNGIQLSIDYHGNEKYLIECRVIDLSHIIINLINNSIDAINTINDKKARWIRLSINISNNYLYIYLSDGGPGISEENKNKLFTSNFTTKSLANGTGFGLVISNKIATENNGDLSLDRNEKNTTFILKLPLKLNHLKNIKAS